MSNKPVKLKKEIKVIAICAAIFVAFFTALSSFLITLIGIYTSDKQNQPITIGPVAYISQSQEIMAEVDPSLTIFFKKGSTEILSNEADKLTSLVDSFKGCYVGTISLQGSASSERYRSELAQTDLKNEELAYGRAINTRSFMLSVDRTLDVYVPPQGPVRRRFRDSTNGVVRMGSAAVRLNRRVDVTVPNLSCERMVEGWSPLRPVPKT